MEGCGLDSCRKEDLLWLWIWLAKSVIVRDGELVIQRCMLVQARVFPVPKNCHADLGS